jgi:hypothetical protein
VLLFYQTLYIEGAKVSETVSDLEKDLCANYDRTLTLDTLDSEISNLFVGNENVIDIV